MNLGLFNFGKVVTKDFFINHYADLLCILMYYEFDQNFLCTSTKILRQYSQYSLKSQSINLTSKMVIIFKIFL